MKVNFKNILLGSFGTITGVCQAQSAFKQGGVLYNLSNDLTLFISSSVIGLLIAITIAFFFWALLRSMLRSQGSDDIKKNKDTMLWGLGILFVMISVWGIIVFFQDALLTSKYKDAKVTLPTIPTSGVQSTSPGGSTYLSPTNSSVLGSGKKSYGSSCNSNDVCDTGFCNTGGKCDLPPRTANFLQ